ncbi:MAG: thiosulfate sulfurtransferase GlpE [Granulosicoccus sp.]|nr:thiosulfate sulfurtransferase GlpE [Granulosicoccus sp.]
MTNYARLSAEDAYQMLLQGNVSFVDIRDKDSYQAGHIIDAVHLDDNSVQSYIDRADTQVPLIVCCYHGNMSQSAGTYLAAQGFSEVYSLDGGFAEWSAKFPDECDP